MLINRKTEKKNNAVVKNEFFVSSHFQINSALEYERSSLVGCLLFVNC